MLPRMRTGFEKVTPLGEATIQLLHKLRVDCLSIEILAETCRDMNAAMPRAHCDKHESRRSNAD